MLVHALIALALIIVTISIHGIGTSACMRFLLRRYATHDGTWEISDRWLVFSFTAVALLGLHFVEVFLWALAYLAIPSIQDLETLESAFYFSLVTFTTLGYGDITLAPGTRILSGIEAISGVLLIGWSTAFTFGVIQRAWQRSYQSQHKAKKASKETQQS